MKLQKLSIQAILLATTTLCLHGFDQLFELKLKIQEKYPPKSQWIKLETDKSFMLEQSVPDSFIKMGVCLQINNGAIYVLDNNLHKLLVFDKKGKFTRKAGILGRGPGDIHFPSWFEFYRNDIYISNNNGIDIFSGDFKFKKRIRPFVITQRFLVQKNRLYCNIPAAYQGRHPLLLRIASNGGIETEFNHKDFSRTNLKYSKTGSIVKLDEKIFFIPRHKNMLYILEHEKRLTVLNKIVYPLLDDVEIWNNRELKKTEEQAVMVWFCNIFASAKGYERKIYLLLQMPRLEILCLDGKGNILKHYYNNTDFRFMRWYDFAIQEEHDRPVFYMLGFSDGDNNDVDQSEFNVFKLKPSGN